MKKAPWLWLVVLFAPLVLIGCTDASKEKTRASSTENKAAEKTTDPQDDEAEIKANLAQLSPEDRKLAEAQKFCAVENENRLGSMGMPFKVLVQDQPVFLCCKGCAKTAQKNPDQTLAKVKELKAKAAGSPAR
jgi:hypothetical protein